MPNARDFLRTIRPPYFDAFFFSDAKAESLTRIVPHSFFKIIAFIEGDVYYTIQDHRYDLIPGDILIAPRFQTYYLHSDGHATYRRLVLWFSGDLLDPIDPSGELRRFFEKIDETRIGACFHFASTDCDEIFNQMYHLVGERDYSKPFGDSVCQAIATLILVRIYRAATSANKSSKEDSEISLLVDNVAAYINGNLRSDLSLDIIADIFFVNKFHLERIFKKKMGVTVHSYIVQRRLVLARQKLYGGESPTQIYQSCGFSSYSSFYRAFQKMYNVSPQQFCAQIGTIMTLEGSQSWNA